MSGSDSNERNWIAAGLDPAAVRALASELPATQVWSLLLAVMEQRAARRKPAALLQQWRTDRFVAPALVDQRTMLELDRELLAAAAQFESIELSPLAPLGTCSVIAPTSQNRVVASLRGSEVVSDPSNVLALASARRLQDDPRQIVKLATSHRCMRAQPYPDKPGFAAHFRIFCMTTAGHETANQQLTVDALAEHIGVHLIGLDRLEQQGYAFPNRVVTLFATPGRAGLAQRVAGALTGVKVELERLEHGYYHGLRFQIGAVGATGEVLPLIDGGAFDWLAQLTANRKMAFVASAIGSQLAAIAYRKLPAA